MWIDVYPLSVAELKRLSWLRARIEAKEWLGRTNETVEPREAGRLAFARWLAATGRLTDEVKA